MAKNKIITSQGNVQFINSKGRTINMHPMHCYAVYEGDTVSFLFIYMKDYSGQAFFASQYEDLEVNGESFDNMEDLKAAINYAFAKAGAQARTEIVDELPEDPFTNTIYLLPKEHGEGYDEYIWNEDEGWQLIGDTDIEFERYLKIDDFNPYSAATKDYIDAVSGETVANHNDIVALSGAIDTEISARTDADTALSGAIDSVASDLADEVSARTAADTTLQNNINTVNGRVDAEQIARAQADTALSGAIDSVSGAVDTEVSARTAADEALDSKIDTVSGDVISETSRAEGAEIALGGRIDDEISARTAADTALQTSKADKVDAVASAEYDSGTTTINFKNISGTVISSIDASDFIKDGMIEDVRIETISGVTYLVIDFNTASGIEDIKIPLTDFFNPDNYYDKTAIDNIVSGLNDSIDEKVAISDFNTYSGAVETELASKFDASAITAYSTSAEVSAEIEAAVSGKADADDVYTKSEVYTKGEVDSAIAQIDLSDYYTSAQTDSKIAEATSGKVDTSDFNTYSASVETVLSGKADASDLASLSGDVVEDERVLGESINDLNTRLSAVTSTVGTIQTTIPLINGRIDAVTGDVATLSSNTLTSGDVQTQIDNSISGKTIDYLSAGTGIDITDNVISVTGGGGGESCTVEETTIYSTTNTSYFDYNGENKLEYIIVDYQGDKTTMTNNFYLVVGDASNDYAQGYMYFDYPNHSASTEGDTALTEYFDVEYISDINDFKVSVASAYQSTCWIKSIQNLFMTNIEMPYYTINSGSPCTVISNDVVGLIEKVKGEVDSSTKYVSLNSSANKLEQVFTTNTGLSNQSNINLEELDGSNNTLKPNIKIGLGTSGWTEITLSDSCNINDMDTNKVRVTYDYEMFESNSMYISIVAIDNNNNSHYDNIQFDQITEQPTFYSNDSYATAVTVTWSASTKELVFEYPATYEDGGETKTLKIKDMGSQNCQFGTGVVTKVETYGENKQDLKPYVQETKAALGGLKLQSISQSDYDDLVSGGTVDASTLYIIND